MTVTYILDFSELVRVDKRNQESYPSLIATSFNITENVLYFKDKEARFYATDLGNIGIGTSFQAFTPGFTSVSIGTGKQVTLGEVDLTLLKIMLSVENNEIIYTNTL